MRCVAPIRMLREDPTRASSVRNAPDVVVRVRDDVHVSDAGGVEPARVRVVLQ